MSTASAGKIPVSGITSDRAQCPLLPIAPLLQSRRSSLRLLHVRTVQLQHPNFLSNFTFPFFLASSLNFLDAQPNVPMTHMTPGKQSRSGGNSLSP